MTARSRPPFDFTRLTPPPIVARPGLSEGNADAPEPPAVTDTDLEIVEAPVLEMPTVEMAADTQSPPPAMTQRPAAEPPSTPAVITQPPTALASDKGPAFWPILIAALIFSAVWPVAPLAFAYGYIHNVAPLTETPVAWMVFGLLVVGPLLLVWISAYTLHQSRKLAAEVRRSRDVATRMLGPAALAAAEAGSAVEAIQGRINAAAASAKDARDTMLALNQSMAEETEKLSETAASAARSARQLSGELARERESLEIMGQTLDASSAAVEDAITRQARMVAEASDLAETQLREAEAALTARAADLAAAAGEASDAARVAAEDLSRQIGRLETAGIGVGDQMRLVEEGLTEQRASLVTAAHAIRADQEDFAAQAETRAAQLAEYMTAATNSATDLSEKSTRSAEMLRQLIGDAATRLGEITAAAQAERESIARQTAESLGKVADIASQERSALEAEMKASIDALAGSAEAARSAAEGHAQAAQGRVDQLNEAAFAAHQKADAIFEARLNDARELIEQSAQMVEQAGSRAAQRLEESVAAVSATLSGLEKMLTEVESRTDSLPAQAQGRVEAIKDSVERGIDELMDAARRTAEETQAIDSAFQERVRRNYDMLSEAARLMGAVAGGASSAAPAIRREAPEPRVSEHRGPEHRGMEALVSPVREPTTRQRLRLTPTATDEEFRSVFDAAGGREPAAPPAARDAAPAAGPATIGDAWSWKDLLQTIDDTPDDAEGLAERLVAEIEAMGIDPIALLPKPKIDEIAAAVQTRDGRGAREVVKRLAPAAIRRLVRRLFSDAALRGQAERYLRRFTGMLDEAAERDRGGLLVAALLSSDGGRAYLLLDAAAGDLA
ncbi:hypothetical protein QO010_000076 [Caulobacter ginsengisoli]|uniref:Polar localization protein TipN n=1 Tax=Caulobacter ginsengisoli TaxID=400775 RepID=A0ABU0IMG7_9CAUL|nr:polar localization protein TipN [Caulobacter ginsengisoli]MDQ0462328.1 hypothetical protein [Caulobacter ginsengisoli]